MGFVEGAKVALFVMSLVFVLLAVIYALIKLTSTVIQRFSGRTNGK